MTSDTLTQAARMVADLEARGATFRLKPNGSFKCDLDPVADITTSDEAATVSAGLFRLSAEIRSPLLARQTRH